MTVLAVLGCSLTALSVLQVEVAEIASDSSDVNDRMEIDARLGLEGYTELCERVPEPLDPTTWLANGQTPRSERTDDCGTDAWAEWTFERSELSSVRLDLGQGGPWELAFPWLRTERILPQGETLSEGDRIEYRIEALDPATDLGALEFAWVDDPDYAVACADLEFDGFTVSGTYTGEDGSWKTCVVSFGFSSELDPGECDIPSCEFSQRHHRSESWELVD